jgi:hypothetical protein
VVRNSARVKRQLKAYLSLDNKRAALLPGEDIRWHRSRNKGTPHIDGLKELLQNTVKAGLGALHGVVCMVYDVCGPDSNVRMEDICLREGNGGRLHLEEAHGSIGRPQSLAGADHCVPIGRPLAAALAVDAELLGFAPW